jgi:hypothetical protein
MLIEQIFYGVFWISAISVVWFYTDWFIHYTQLLNIAESERLSYLEFINKNPDKYFPDFLFKKSLKTENRILKFVYKLSSCPFCLILWLAFAASLICSNVLLTAPFYVLSLLVTLQIKKMI